VVLNGATYVEKSRCIKTYHRYQTEPDSSCSGRRCTNAGEYPDAYF